MLRTTCLLLLALPLQAADFRITSYSLTPSNFSLAFPTKSGRVYGVERTESLAQGWAVQATYCGSGSEITFTEALRPRASFYRVSDASSPPLQLFPAQPTMTSGAVSLPDAILHQSYAIDISPCPSGTAPFSFEISGTPPTGLILTVMPNSVQVRGAPINLARTEFEITVTDATSATTKRKYNIRPINPPPVIMPATVTLKAGRAANFALSGSGGTSNLFWTVDSGNLPEGITLAATGFLVGTPTAASAEVDETGLHSAVLRVRDQHTDRVTDAPAPRTATAPISSVVGLSWNLNLFAARANGPSFSAGCYACHGPGFGPDVTSGNAADVIGVSSSPFYFCPDRIYVSPNQPEQSLLYKKLTDPQCGDRMPFGGPYMNSIQTGRLLRWIVELQPGEQD